MLLFFKKTLHFLAILNSPVTNPVNNNYTTTTNNNNNNQHLYSAFRQRIQSTAAYYYGIRKIVTVISFHLRCNWPSAHLIST